MYANEWLTLGWRNTKHLDDYSEPMVQRFRQWLRDWYQNDETRLRRSWNAPDVTFDTAEIPTASQRRGVNSKHLLNVFTETGSQVADFNRCDWETNVRAAIRICRVIKETAPNKLTFLMHGNKPAARLTLESKWVDGCMAPTATATGNGPIFLVPHESFRQHNKLYLDQTDTGTHLLPRWGGYQARVGGLWTPPRLAENLWESLEILERDIAYPLTKNSQCYWNEGGPGWMFPIYPHGVTTWGRFWFDDPDIKALIGRLKDIVDDNQKAGAKSTAEVACVFSQDLLYYLPPDLPYEHLFGRRGFQQLIMARAGVPFDEYLLEDFEHIQRDGTRSICFPTPCIPESQRVAIRRKLAAKAPRQSGSMALDTSMKPGWVWTDVHVTGMRFRVEDTPGCVQVKLGKKNHPFLCELDSIQSFGSATATKSDAIIPFEDFGCNARAMASRTADGILD